MFDCNVMVPTPLDAFFVLVPTRVPSPETVNVRAFVAVVTGVLPASHTVDVIREVAEPSATILTGDAVLITFVGLPGTVVTSTVL